MGRQTNVKNVFAKERMNKGERKEARRRGRSVEGMEGPMMAVNLSLFMTMLHTLFSQNNPSNHCSKKSKTESRMSGDLSEAALPI